MLPRLHWLLAATLLTGCLGLSRLAALENAIVPKIKDDAKLFTDEGLDRANKKIKEIYRRYDKDVQVDTVAGVPESLQDKLKKAGKEEFFLGWARERATDLGVHGIYIL